MGSGREKGEPRLVSELITVVSGVNQALFLLLCIVGVGLSVTESKLS